MKTTLVALRTPRFLTVALLVAAAFPGAQANEPGDAARPAIRAVVPRTAAPLAVDGKLDEQAYGNALCTPVEYFHPNAANRAAQFYYLWDDEAFYVGLRTLDEQAFSPETPLWEGDAVEWYFDVRRDANFLSRSWPKEPSAGAVHCFFTPMRLAGLKPRFTLRPGFEQAIPQKGIEVAAQRTAQGLEAEFKLPWVNFPDFAPRVREVIGIDAELSYSDGGPRSDRSFVFGSPLSVQQPANLARVELVETLDRAGWKASGPVMMPLRVDVPWGQPGEPQVVGQIALPPNRADEVGRVVFQVVDLAGNVVGEFEAATERKLAPEGDFIVREARWPASMAAPGTFDVRAVVYSHEGEELTRVAPRLVSVNMQQGY